ncbi:MAG: glycoside hydrolase family 92 protein [Planctomycetaceae bacterium]
MFSVAVIVGATATAWSDDQIRPGERGAQVNCFIGTGGLSYLCGNTFPGATLPFGMVRLSPDTVSTDGKRATNMSGYYYHDDRILGFSHTRLSGTGAVDGGNFLVLPGLTPGTPPSNRQGLNLKLNHRDETAWPGYYRHRFPEKNLIAELTATRRVGVHRYTFTGDEAPRLAILVSSVLGKGSTQESQLRIHPDKQELEGSVRTFGTFAKRYGGLKTYFVARCNRRFANFGTWQGETFTERSDSAAGDDLGAELVFETGENQIVELKLAISYVSIDNARANLDAEAGDFDFDQIHERARAEWEEKLGRILVTGGSPQEQTIFYTSLYHSLIMPTVFSDVNGQYFGFDNKVHQATGFDFYTDMSLWDTFRTTHPLFTLIAPAHQARFSGLVGRDRQTGRLSASLAFRERLLEFHVRDACRFRRRGILSGKESVISMSRPPMRR